MRIWAAVLVPCAGALLFGLLSYALNGPRERAFGLVAADGIFGALRYRCRNAKERFGSIELRLHAGRSRQGVKLSSSTSVFGAP